MTAQSPIRESLLESRATPSTAPVKRFSYTDAICLNLAPIHFSKDQFEAGRTPYLDEDHYRAVRDAHQATHAFRFDARDSMIYNVPMSDGLGPLGTPTLINTREHLALLGKAINHALLTWLGPRRTTLRRTRPLQCWGNRKAALLSAAIRDRGLEPITGLDVLTRHSFDPRVLHAPGQTSKPFLALLFDVSTSNEVNIPVKQLLADKFDPLGSYVCTRPEHSWDNVLSRLETLGKVCGYNAGRLQLTDCAGNDCVDAVVSCLSRAKKI